MNKEVYVLTLEMYNEWAWENGACDVIGVYDDLSILEKDLKAYLSSDIEAGYILNNHDSIDELLDFNNEDNYYNGVDVYTSEENYQNGYNNGTYCVYKKYINERAVTIDDEGEDTRL
mgnify:FL=1